MLSQPIFKRTFRPETRWLITLTISCMMIYLLRIYLSGNLHYFFMPWNLFLGFVPFIFSRLIRFHPLVNGSRFFLLSATFLWLIFFPNAPYMLTDLFHLHSRATMPLWYDLFFVLSFAWTGLLAGFVSLWDIEQMLKKRQRIPSVWIPRISSGMLVIASFGIYLGRYLRWNSWDLFLHPMEVLTDVADRFIHPMQHAQTWGMTLLTGFFLNVLYHSLRLIRKHSE